jgi:dihydrofolate reductase
MRRVLYSAAMSLDGFIARRDGSFDWIPMDEEMDWGAFMDRFDTVLMGRHTYEVTMQQGAGSGSPGMETYVFSRTLRPEDHPGVTVVADDAAGLVASLRDAEGKDIWLMGGGVLFRSLLDAGLVDRVEVGLVPILLGDGIPFLPPGGPETRLALTNIQRYPSGVTILNYDVRRDGEP